MRSAFVKYSQGRLYSPSIQGECQHRQLCLLSLWCARFISHYHYVEHLSFLDPSFNLRVVLDSSLGQALGSAPVPVTFIAAENAVFKVIKVYRCPEDKAYLYFSYILGILFSFHFTFFSFVYSLFLARSVVTFKKDVYILCYFFLFSLEGMFKISSLPYCFK